MQHHRLPGNDEQRFLLVFADGDELVSGLARFAARHGIGGAEFTCVGAFASLELDGGRRLGTAHIRSLDGTLAVVDGRANVSAYAVVQASSGERHAGRLTRGVVREALKLVFTETYSGSRASPSSTATRPSPLSERKAS